MFFYNFALEFGRTFCLYESFPDEFAEEIFQNKWLCSGPWEIFGCDIEGGEVDTVGSILKVGRGGAVDMNTMGKFLFNPADEAKRTSDMLNSADPSTNCTLGLELSESSRPLDYVDGTLGDDESGNSNVGFPGTGCARSDDPTSHRCDTTCMPPQTQHAPPEFRSN